MDCPTCRYPDSRVVYTTHNDEVNQIYRRRECLKCAGRYTTQEHYREDYKRGPYKTQPPHKILLK